MLQSAKELLQGFLLHDYLLFGAIFLVALLLLLVTFLLRKRPFLALLLFMFGAMALVGGSYFAYDYLHAYLFKSRVEIVETKKLTFTKAVVLKAKLYNDSKFDFSECKVEAALHKKLENRYKNLLQSYKYIAKESIIIKDLAQGGVEDIKLLIEPFSYDGEFYAKMEAKCRHF